MKIRIGNDIKLDVYLSKQHVPDTVNIKSIKAILVNSSFKVNPKDCCPRHIQLHLPSKYDINNMGMPTYNVPVHCGPIFNPCCDGPAHNMHEGPQPWSDVWFNDHEPHMSRWSSLPNDCNCDDKTVRPYCGESWPNLNKPGICSCNISKPGLPHERSCGSCNIIDDTPFIHCPKPTLWACRTGWWKDLHAGDFAHHPIYDSVYYHDPENFSTLPYEYYAKVKSTSEKDRVEVFYPAADQRILGKYTLVIIAKIYEPGYDCGNLRTITVDYPNAFELVENSNEADVSSSVTIVVGEASESDATAIQILDDGVSTVIKGSIGYLIAKVLPSCAKDKEVMWSIDDENVEILSSNGSTFTFKGVNIPDVKSCKYVATVTAFLKNKPTVKTTKQIMIINYAKDITVSTANYDGKSLPSGSTATLIPSVIMTNDELIRTYNDNNTIKPAVTSEIQSSTPGVNVTITHNANTGAVELINNNQTVSNGTVVISFTSNIPDDTGNYPTTLRTFNLGSIKTNPNNQSDKFLTNAQYNEGNYDLEYTMNDNQKISIPMDNEFSWYEN